MSSFAIKTMSRAEVDFALDLAAREGWNPGLDDAECFYRADPGAFLVGLLEGQPIGCISAVSYEGRFGFIGLYIVLPEQRGKGYGVQLWNAAVERLGGHVIGLDGVVEQQANYAKSGFQLAHRNIRYEGRASGKRDPSLKSILEVPFAQIEALDQSFFPANRRSFLEAWIRMPHGKGLAWIENDRLLGYGVIRQCRRGYKIGPLFAERADMARTIYEGLCSEVAEGEPVFLDIPEVNPSALDLVEKLGMVKVFETARMYAGLAPRLPLQRTFGITTFELG